MTVRKRGDWNCVAPYLLEPAAELVPDSGASSDVQSQQQSNSSPSDQTSSKKPQTDSSNLGSQKSQPIESGQKASEQGESQGKNDHQIAPQHLDSQTSQPTNSQEKQSEKETPQGSNDQKSNGQLAQAASDKDLGSAAPKSVSKSANPPIIVQGQTVPTDGRSIVVNNQPVKVSSGYIYVGSSSTPIPKAQVLPLGALPIVAGTLTFQPAAPSPIPQVDSSPFVVGGLTFSASQPAPSDDLSGAPGRVNSRPLIIGGKVYAPVVPSPQSAAVPAANVATNDEQNEPEKYDARPVVAGGMTYTPIGANPTPAPGNAAVFSFRGIALTQGGAAVTISGTRYSLGSSDVVVGTSSLQLSTATPITSLLAIGSETLTALPGSGAGFEIDHSTLLPGAPAVTISGTVYSINQAGSLIVGTSTIPLANADTANPSDKALTAGGETFTPVGSTAVVMDGTTLSVGGSAITENGTRISLASNGLLVGSSTFAYPTPAPNADTVPTATGASATGVVPGAGTTVAILPYETAGFGTSAAPSKAVTPGATMAVIPVFMSLSCIILI